MVAYAVETSEEEQVLPGRRRRVERKFLWSEPEHMTDSPWVLGDVVACHLHVTGVEPDEAHGCSGEGGISGAIVTDQSHNLSGRHREVEPV